MALCKLLIVLVLMHHAGDVLGAVVGSSIVGGQDAPQGRWPFMANLNFTYDGKHWWSCGGTIVNNQWVMTAAHCLKTNPEPSTHRSVVWIGSYKLDDGALRYRKIYSSVAKHQFAQVGSGFVNDIALIKLDKKLVFSDAVNSVSLPAADDSFGPSSECYIIGWGQTANNVPLRAPKTMQQARVSILPQSVCKEQYPNITPDMLCAGGKVDACKGDYGGPLVCRKNGGYVQVGIMSYGSSAGCGLTGRSGVYTQVSRYLNFINGYIHHSEEASTEV